MLDETKIVAVKQLMACDTWAQLKSLRYHAGQVDVDMFIQAQLAHFSGHFPQQPVLAGVVQTHWACELGKLLFDIQQEFCGMENLKFLAVILPEQHLCLSLNYRQDKRTLEFCYANNEARYSQGRVKFGTPA